MDKFLLQFASLSFSILLYLLLIYLFFVTFLDRSHYKKVQIKGEPIEVVIVDKEKGAARAPRRPKVSKKIKQKSGSSSPKSGSADLRSLFASIDAKRLSEKKLTHARANTTPSRKRGSSAKELLQKLDLKTFTFSSEKKSIKAVSGEQDAYMQKVYRILYENWLPSRLSAGHWAKVRFVIDPSGQISYQVIEWSSNDTFNEELRQYLEYIQQLHFPKPQKKRVFIVRFEAKE